MKFNVTIGNSKNSDRIPRKRRSECFLFTNSWNDYGYKTLFELYFIDSEGETHKIGLVRIGNSSTLDGSTYLPETFDNLEDIYFSLGTYEGYYEKLNDLNPEDRLSILSTLNDIAYDLERFSLVEYYDITQKSLLRSTTAATVKGQLHRIALGGAKLSKYNFIYTLPNSNEQKDDLNLSFNVMPDSPVPSNIHILIGRNGVGKTTLLLNMTRAFVYGAGYEKQYGSFIFNNTDSSDEIDVFANVVSVAFSAFDKFDPIPNKNHTDESFSKSLYTYIGLKKYNADEYESVELKKPKELEEDFSKSIIKCLSDPKGKKKSLWANAIKVLEADPVFEEAGFQSLQKFTKPESIAENALPIFKNLSSGHKIIILTITKLVEVVEERTLLLIDEPESHLHPPLLASFIRALSELLMDRNGIAIIATHSPVVLQEVPANCVWILDRTGVYSSVYRPTLETFGENPGILTSEVFGLEVTRSGFHRVLQNASNQLVSYNLALDYFNNELSGEAKAILRLIYNQKKIKNS